MVNDNNKDNIVILMDINSSLIWIKFLWSLRWNESSSHKELCPKNVHQSVCLTATSASPPIVHFLWAVVLFYTAWVLMTSMLWKHFLSNQVLRLWRLKSLGGLWGNTWQDIQYQHLVWQSCTESVLARGWNFTNTVHLREIGTSLSFIPWCNRNNCHDKSIMAKKK